MPLTFVAGTGRCGSTMLSNILHMHPKILGLNEYWTVLSGRRLMSDADILIDNEYLFEEMSGQSFWRLISTPDTTPATLFAGIEPYDGELERLGANSRFSPETGIPVIMHVLVWVNDDPDALYDQLAAEVPAWSPRPTVEHCRALFDRLGQLVERPFVVERSGASLRGLPVLRQRFPDARFVFLYREGPDTALSMSRHFLFRFDAMQRLGHLAESSSSLLSQYPEMRSVKIDEMRGLMAPPFDMKQFMAFPLPRTLFARLWSLSICDAVNEFRKLSADRWITVRYENLLDSPREELTRLLDFIGAPVDPVMLDAARKAIDGGRSGGAAAALHPVERAEVRNACAPGAQAFELLDSAHG